jgi:hypothetical protein
MAVVTMCLPRRRFRSAPRRRAQLSPSVPQEVKTTSPGAHPRAAATVSRSAFTLWAASRPNPYREEGLPKPSNARSRASRASGRTGVVAA